MLFGDMGQPNGLPQSKLLSGDNTFDISNRVRDFVANTRPTPLIISILNGDDELFHFLLKQHLDEPSGLGPDDLLHLVRLHLVLKQNRQTGQFQSLQKRTGLFTRTQRKARSCISSRPMLSAWLAFQSVSPSSVQSW